MAHADVSFTFLDRVQEIEQNVADRRWQSALALALTLPDICGGIAFPEIVKKYRDGRVMLDRQNNPTRDVGGQYIRWFDTYAAPFFKQTDNAQRPYICGERCWQLRCEYLHQNKGFDNEDERGTTRFHLGVNCGSSVCGLDQAVIQGDSLDVRIDIEQFCLRMCRAARNYYESASLQKEFALYNTPVLDFIQLSQPPARVWRSLYIVCGDGAYGMALQKTLEESAAEIRVFPSAEKARKKAARNKPDLWLILESFLSQPDQPWRSDPAVPVVVIGGMPGQGADLSRLPEHYKVIPSPVQPAALRETIRSLGRRGEGAAE